MFNSLWKKRIRKECLSFLGKPDPKKLDVFVAVREMSPTLGVDTREKSYKSGKAYNPCLMVGKQWLKENLTPKEWASYVADKMDKGMT